MSEPPLVAVIGSGPAGLSAARVLLKHDAEVVLFDESPASGGQYYKQYSAASRLERPVEIERLHQDGLQRFTALQSDRLTVRHSRLVWGIFAGNQIATYADDAVDLLKPDAIVLATGAIEKAIAFPGWTLPGVMTAGGAQTLLSREAILPGKRFLLAGTGPLLLPIALEIAEAGGQVVAVIEGRGYRAPARYFGAALTHPRRIRQLRHYLAELRKRKIPVLRRQMITAARGEGFVSEAVVSKIDADWNVIPDTETTYEVDTICLHAGFAGSIELAQQAGCDIAWSADRGGWHVVHDERMRTSQSGIYVAGQPAGIGGADLSEATGELAALSVLNDLDLLEEKPFAKQSRRASRGVKRGRSFASMLNNVFAPGPGAIGPIEQDTLICRCEEVSRSEIDQAIARGARTLNDVKRQTRCGMGYCQGRFCAPTLALVLESQAGIDREQTGTCTAQAPVKPIPLKALATMPDPDL